MLNTRAISIKHQTVIGLCVVTFGVLLAWEIGGWIVAGNLIQVGYLAVAAAVAVVSIGILRNWRSGVYMFLIWLVFEDLVRKYLGNNMAIFFAKDVLAALIYISIIRAIRNHHEKAFRPPFLLAISFFFWWAVIQIFNPYSPSPLYGAIGSQNLFFLCTLHICGLRSGSQRPRPSPLSDRGFVGGDRGRRTRNHPGCRWAAILKPCDARARNPRACGSR